MSAAAAAHPAAATAIPGASSSSRKADALRTIALALGIRGANELPEAELQERALVAVQSLQGGGGGGGAGAAASPRPAAAAASAVKLPPALRGHPEKCDVVIRCHILTSSRSSSSSAGAGPAPQAKPVAEGKEGVAEAEAGHHAAKAPPAEASAAVPGQEEHKEQEERKEDYSADEEDGAAGLAGMVDAVDATMADAAAEAGHGAAAAAAAVAADAAGKRKRAGPDSGEEGHKKAKPAQAAAGTDAAEHSASSSSGNASSSTGVVIALRAPPAAGVGGLAAAGGGACSGSDGRRVHVIYAHSAVLAEKSPYFDRAFRGGWREMHSRELSVTFDDEDEFEDFARLVRLCHGPSFLYEEEEETEATADGAVSTTTPTGRRRELRREELLRLLLVADAFEVRPCVRACAGALCRGMTYALAVKAFLVVPEAMKQQQHFKRVLTAAGRALARGAGVLGGPRTWHRRRPDLTRGGKDKYVRFLPDLSPKLQLLPPLAMEFLLRSDALRVRSENDAFAVVCAWVKGRKGLTRQQQQRAFNALMPCLRWHAMTGEFLTTVVSHNRWVVGSGRLLDVLRGALCFRDSRAHVGRYLAHQQQHHEEEDEAFQQQQQQQQQQAGNNNYYNIDSDSDSDDEDDEQEGGGHGDGGGGAAAAAAARARRRSAQAAARAFAPRAEDDDDETYELKGTFSLSKCLQLPAGKFVRRHLGVVQGVPCFLDLERSILDAPTNGNNGGAARGNESLGLFFGLCNNLANDHRATAPMGGSPGLAVGSLVRYDITVRDCQRGPSVDVFSNSRQPWGFRDVLGLPWSEVVRQGSAYFDARGRMEVRVRVRFLRDPLPPPGAIGGGDAFYEDDDSSDDDQEDEEEDEEEVDTEDEEDVEGEEDSDDEEDEEVMMAVAGGQQQEQEEQEQEVGDAAAADVVLQHFVGGNGDGNASDSEGSVDA